MRSQWDCDEIVMRLRVRPSMTPNRDQRDWSTTRGDRRFKIASVKFSSERELLIPPPSPTISPFPHPDRA